MRSVDVAIVGAGICGLTLATKLSDSSISNLIIEKSKGVGGRMATRRDGNATYDHGASFYADTTAEPCLWDRRWSNSLSSKVWFIEGGRRHIVGTKGMTTLAKDLAIGNEFIFGEKVVLVKPFEDGIELLCESGQVSLVETVVKTVAKTVVLTCPLPQSLDILKRSGIEYPEALNAIEFSSALVGLFELESNSKKFDFNLLRPDSSIFTISNNQNKGISKNLGLSIVMNEAWSKMNFAGQDEITISLIKEEFGKYFGEDVLVHKSQLKKWRYCQPTSLYPGKYFSLCGGRIILAGDSFGGGSIAGSIRSASAVLSSIFSIS